VQYAGYLEAIAFVIVTICLLRFTE